MEYSTLDKGQEISAEGVMYDKGSVYGRLQTLTDMRKARGKRYNLTTLMMTVLLAKLSGADSPIGGMLRSVKTPFALPSAMGPGSWQTLTILFLH